MFNPNLAYYRQRRQPGPMAAFLLGAGPMPPPTQQEIAVAIANCMPDNATPGPANFHNDDNDDNEENIDPQLLGQVLTRMPVNDNLTRDIEIDVGITFQDFVGLRRRSKTCTARQLDNEDDLKNVFRDFLKNAKPTEAPKKKTDGNRTTDFAYREELKLMQEKLRPEDPKEYIKLGVEVTLWARKLKDDPDVNRNCDIPPNCLSLDHPCERTKKTASNATVKLIHVNITNNPLAASSSANWLAYHSCGIKRAISAISYSSDDGTDSEYLTVSDLLTELHDFYIDLCMAEGAIDSFMRAIGKALKHKKRAELENKENKENKCVIDSNTTDHIACALLFRKWNGITWPVKGVRMANHQYRKSAQGTSEDVKISGEGEHSQSQTPQNSGILAGAENFLISGGTFNVTHQHYKNYDDKWMELLRSNTVPGAFHNSDDRRDPPKCHPHTREAVIKDIMDWVIDADRKEQFCWVYGPAGSGKSSIAQTIAELCEEQGRLASNFFFARTVPGRNTYTHLIATLAYQLALFIPDIREYMAEAIQTDGLVFTRSLPTQLDTVILQPLARLTCRKCNKSDQKRRKKPYPHLTDGLVFTRSLPTQLDTVILQPLARLTCRKCNKSDQKRRKKPYPHLVIIDGLDECDGHQNQGYILSSFSSILKTASVSLIFLVASRPEHAIR
ncbi:hypothetical protein CVT25_009181, partial [Psilocybe cyanescens]